MKDKLVTSSYCFILAANFLLYFGFWLLIPVLPFYLSEVFSAANPNELIIEGASLYVYHSPLMAYSMPPQTSAFVFVGNLPADAGCPHYHVAEDRKSVV